MPPPPPRRQALIAGRQVACCGSAPLHHLYTADRVPGQLLNISEGGAAIRTALEIDPLELVHFWLADAPVPLPQLKAGVVDVVDGEEENPPTLQLYFIDPPLQQLRALICQLQRQQYDEYAEVVEDEEGEGLSNGAVAAS